MGFTSTTNKRLEEIIVKQLAEHLMKTSQTFRQMSEIEGPEAFIQKVGGEVKLDVSGILVISYPDDAGYLASFGFDFQKKLKSDLPQVSGQSVEAIHRSLLSLTEKTGPQVDVSVIGKSVEDGIGWYLTQSKDSESLTKYLNGPFSRLQLKK